MQPAAPAPTMMVSDRFEDWVNGGPYGYLQSGRHRAWARRGDESLVLDVGRGPRITGSARLGRYKFASGRRARCDDVGRVCASHYQPRTIYACSTPLSSELKNPDRPFGDRNGWIWVSFVQDDPGSATFRAFVIGPLSSSGMSNSQTVPPPSLGPASVIRRFPPMSVAKCQKLGPSKLRDRSFLQLFGVFIPS